MRSRRSYLLITLTSLALIIVLAIQVNWILETARVKEQLFNEKANIVLARTTEALAFDKSYHDMETNLGPKEIARIDSLLLFYMRFYNFHIPYYFEIKPGISKADNDNISFTSFPPSEPACYKKNLDDYVQQDGWELKLAFPEKKQYILAEMGVPFFSSVLLILVVLGIFWKTILSLMKEKQISEQTTDFLNNMTHEFKTPLTNIALAGKMLIRDNNIHQEEKVKHYSGIIIEENEKLSRQVEQVLGMSALERGEIPLNKNELNAHQIIKDAIKCFSIQIEDKRAVVSVELDAKNSTISADKNHFTSALCNLLDNALKYSKEEPRLFIQTTNHNGMIVIDVYDQGIGIEKEHQKKIFEKFFRVPTGNLHDVKGFGIGLSYTKSIIELHNGTISLESEKDKGTKFTICLPNV